MSLPPDNGALPWPDSTYPARYPPYPGSSPLPQQYPPTAAYPSPPYYPPPPVGPTLPASGALPPPPPFIVAPQYSEPIYGQVAHVPPVDPGAGVAIAALVLGIVGLPMMFFGVCDLPFVVAGIICGVIGVQRSTNRRGVAIAGLVLSLLPLALAIVIAVIALLAHAQSHG